MKLVAFLSALGSSLALVACDNGDDPRKRQLQHDLKELRSWANEGPSESVRCRAKSGLALLENGVDDGAPFIIKAAVAFEDVDAVKEGGKGPILGVHFISEVYSQGTLDMSDGQGGWVHKWVGDERPRAANERSLRAIVIPIASLPMKEGSPVLGVELRLSIRGMTSNVVRVERVRPSGHPVATPAQSFEARTLPVLNPTSWEFGASIEEVRGAIAEAFGRSAWRELIILFKEDGSVFAEKVFKAAGNEHDVYLHNHHTPIGDSLIYVRNGSGLKYLAEFHLHLTRIQIKRTRVEVITLKPEVIAGQTPGWMSPHGPANIYVPVAATTIEEYELLLRLGTELKEKGMPGMVLPK